ncbi:hypothetical protein L257_00500 [Brucella abortus 82-3893]|nr:hypothetical protein L257_00500 [Brucella abortus 82-3893]
MNSSPVKHVVFDIGKVLIHYDPELAFLDIIPDAGERRWFLENICTSAWNIEQDRGRSWQEAEALLLESHPQHHDHIRAFRRNWSRMVPHAYDDSVEILRGLIAAGHDVTMLTNFASDTFREAQGPLSLPDRKPWRDGFRRYPPHQTRPGDLRSSRRLVRPRSGSNALHR